MNLKEFDLSYLFNSLCKLTLFCLTGAHCGLKCNKQLQAYVLTLLLSQRLLQHMYIRLLDHRQENT